MMKEAYEEFKHVLLAFIYDKDNQTSPVTYEVNNIHFSLFTSVIITFSILKCSLVDVGHAVDMETQ